MTLIVGLARGEQVWIGADASSNDEGLRMSTINPKVFVRGDMLIACAGSQRVRDVLEMHLPVIGARPGQDGREHIIMNVVPKISALLSKHEAITHGATSPAALDDSELVIGYRGGLHYVDKDFSVVQFTDTFVTAGAASEIAMGIMAALTDRTRMTPHKMISYAMARTARYHNQVCAPYTILTI